MSPFSSFPNLGQEFHFLTVTMAPFPLTTCSSQPLYI